ncbi:hypothetical protein ACU8MG_25450 (plasmid) [Rhizobium leguminosarum]
MAKAYEKHLFGTLTLQDLPNNPRFIFCATNLQNGVLFRFSKPYAGDYVIGRVDKPQVRLSQAVAASSPVLSPLELKLPEGSFTDWPSRSGAPSMLPDELAALRSRVVLTDGGEYDNHGLEPVVKRYVTILVSDGVRRLGEVPISVLIGCGSSDVFLT